MDNPLPTDDNNSSRGATYMFKVLRFGGGFIGTSFHRTLHTPARKQDGHNEYPYF